MRMSIKATSFKERSQIALDAMEQYANKIGIVGVCAYLESEDSSQNNFQSIFRILGQSKIIASDGTGYNFISIAYSKIAESIETGKDSGSLTRPFITGEFGWKGSSVFEFEDELIITSFSGSTEDIDLEIASVGLSSIKSL